MFLSGCIDALKPQVFSQNTKTMKKQFAIIAVIAFVAIIFIGSSASAQWNQGTGISWTNDNVGIGFNSPSQTLDVNGSLGLGVGSQIFVRRTDQTLHGMFTMDGNDDVIINRSSLVDGLVSGLIFGVGSGKRFEVRNSSNQVIMRIWEGSQRLDYDGEISVGKDRAFSATRQDNSRQELFVLDGMDNIILNRSALLGGEASSIIIGVGAGERYEVRNSTNSPILRINEANGLMTLNGKIITKEVEVKLDVWPDFVFDDDYNLRSLNEVESFIIANRHLPGVPTEADVLANGAKLGEVSAILLQKVEELTLYVIELNKQNEILRQKISELDK